MMPSHVAVVVLEMDWEIGGEDLSDVGEAAAEAVEESW